MGRGVNIVLPFIAAAVAPAALAFILFALFSGDLKDAAGIGLLVVVVAGAHVVVLGIPGYAFLHWCNRIRWWSLTALGFVAGCIPFGIFAWPLQHSNQEFRSSSQENGVWTMIDGVPTPAGWLQYGTGIAWYGAFGAAGALALWFTRMRMMHSNNSLERTRAG